MVKRLKRNLIPFISYHLFLAVLLVFFGNTGADILYFMAIMGTMAIHLFIVLLIVVDHAQNDTADKWTIIDLIIIGIACWLYYYFFDAFLDILFKLNQMR